MTQLSREDRALLQYAHDSGVPMIATTTINHSTKTSTGGTSRHVQQGTDGTGLAVDFAFSRPTRDSPELAAIYLAFVRAAPKCFELIYAGPVDGRPATCFKRGKPFKYPQVVLDGHHNHVHVAVDRGVFLKWTGAAAPSTPGGKPNVKVNAAPRIILTHESWPKGSYTIVEADGGTHPFGGAPFLGSLAATPLNKPIVGGTVTADGKGLLLLGADGGVFPLGEATYQGRVEFDG